MAQFSIHTPIAPATLRDRIKRDKMMKRFLPIGLIGESRSFSYGYDGATYYVSEGVFNHLVTKAKMNFEEAKALYDALVYVSPGTTDGINFTSLLKAGRKSLAGESNLFWFFVKNIDL